MKRAVLLAFGLLLATTVNADDKPKRQVVDLEKLDIEGSIPIPATMFIHERKTDGLFELFPLKRELPEDWFGPVMKGNFDSKTALLVDERKR